MIARWLDSLGEFIFEIRQNAGKDITHADCLSPVQTKESGITTFVTALTKNYTTAENDTIYSWQILRETDRKNQRSETETR